MGHAMTSDKPFSAIAKKDGQSSSAGIRERMGRFSERLFPAIRREEGEARRTLRSPGEVGHLEHTCLLVRREGRRRTQGVLVAGKRDSSGTAGTALRPYRSAWREKRLWPTFWG